MGKWIYVPDSEESAESDLFVVYHGQLEEIDDSQSIPSDDTLWIDEGDPSNEDDCVANGWDLPE